jgi:hypothetical protein
MLEEVYNAIIRAYWVILIAAQETRMLIGIWRVKAILMRFQMGRRTPLGNGLEAMCITFWQRT